MTAKGRTRDRDVTVVEPLAHRLKPQNRVNVHRHSAHKYRRSADKHVTSRKVDAKSTRRKSLSESPRQSPKRASDQKVNANSFPTEKSLGRHLKEDEKFDVTGVKGVSNGNNGFADMLSLSPKKVSDQNAAEEDCGIERLHKEEDQQSDSTKFKEDIRGGNENHRSVGWSVLIKGPEHAEISKTDEDDMLRLSQSSATEEPALEGSTLESNVTPSKRKKKRENGVVKWPRTSGAKRSLSNHICEIMGPMTQSPEGLKTALRLAKDSEPMRTKTTAQVVSDADDKEIASPELPKKVGSVQNCETALAEEDAMENPDKLSHNACKSLSSSEIQKNHVITLSSVGAPGHKRRKNEEKQCRHDKRDIRGAADPSDSQGFSASDPVPREKAMLKTRNSIIDVEENALRRKAFQKLQERRFSNARESDGLQRDGGLDNLAEPKGDAALLSGSAGTEENVTDIEDSPLWRGKKLPTGENGYSMSKEAIDIGRLVRKQLLAGRGNSNEPDTSKESSSRADSSRDDERSSDARAEPKSALDDSEGTQHQQIVENSQTQATNAQRRVLKRPRTTCGTETEREKHTQNIHNESNLTRGLAAGQIVVNSPSVRKHREYDPTEVEDCCLRLSGFRHRSTMEAKAPFFDCFSRAPDDGMKSTKEVSSKGSYLDPYDSARLDSAQNTQHFDVKQLGRESKPRRRKPEHSSLRDKEFSVPGSIPGDMSGRNHLRMHKRKQREVRETLPSISQCRPSPEQKKAQKQKKSPKSHVTSSSVVKVTRECQSTTRSATKLVRPSKSEGVLGQPIVQSGDKEEMDSVEAEDISNRVSISIDDAEQTENVSMEEKRSKQSQNSPFHPRKEFEVGRALDEIAPGVGTCRAPPKEKKLLSPTEKDDSGYASVEKTSIKQNLDDLVDQETLKEQSQLLIRRSKRSKRSRIGGARQDRAIKALDELSDNEDSKDEAWVPASSHSQQRSRTKQVPNVQPQKTHHMKTRGKESTSYCVPLEPAAIIDLTDIGDDETTVADTRGTKDDDDIAESLQELQRLSLEDKTKGISDRPGCKYLTPLSDDESKLAMDLTTRTKRDTKIVAIAEAGITLRAESFKRLRGTRWLDDEVLNAYVSLINTRNDAVFCEMDEEHRLGIPRTYVFNTYFFTRLCSGSSGFDYPGVKGWTKRAKVDILKRDIILVPINLGNHHWVL